MATRKHYKHRLFEQVLVNASAKKTLAKAAPEWIFSHFGVYEKSSHCQICHARIKQFVAIKNTENGVVLLIGGDCYDKLLQYFATNKVEAVSLPSRRKYIGEIKKYCKKEINASFLAWFRSQKRLSKQLKEALKVIGALGYAPSLAAAEELVQYYKNHRQFRLDELMELDDVDDLYVAGKFFGIDIPKVITISELSVLQNTIASLGNELNEHVELVKKGMAKIPLNNFAVVRRTHSISMLRTKIGGRIVMIRFTPIMYFGLDQGEVEIFQEAAPPYITAHYRPDRPYLIEPTHGSLEVWRERFQRRKDSLKKAIRVTFVKGRNPKHGNEQWEARLNGRLLVLRREDRYDPSEGEVLVTEQFELVPGRIVLVGRI